MKDIDKLIRNYVLEIVVVVIFVIISYPVWKLLDKSEMAKIASSYANMNYLYLDIDKYVSTNDFYDAVTIWNETNTKRGYDLVVKIEKESIDDNLEVIINDKKYSLNSKKYKEDNKYIYYKLVKGTVVGGNVTYNIDYLSDNINYTNVTYEIIESREV
ncbi:MAG: hypothetical protein E7158_02235 [Firmicutes bacterium]|nr:hypothetical protein [Bacillota bacterium]